MIGTGLPPSGHGDAQIAYKGSHWRIRRQPGDPGVDTDIGQTIGDLERELSDPLAGQSRTGNVRDRPRRGVRPPDHQTASAASRCSLGDVIGESDCDRLASGRGNLMNRTQSLKKLGLYSKKDLTQIEPGIAEDADETAP